MNNFLDSHLKKLSNHFDYPELELRVLLNKASNTDKEIFLVILILKKLISKYLRILLIED